MNLIDFYVTEIVSSPYAQYGKWWVDVKADSWGTISKQTIMFKTLDDAKRLEIGYKFLA